MRRAIKFIAVAAVAVISGALVMHDGRPAQAATDVLPNLHTRPLTNFRIENTGGEKRLRFTTIIANKGPGTFEVRLNRPNTSQANMAVRQRVYNSEGLYRYVSADTHGFWGGDGHNHWHVKGLQRFRIYTDVNGEPASSKASGAKIGFCFYDNTVYDLSRDGAPDSPHYKGCGTERSLGITTGISVGWADTYSWNLNRQWIKINGLPNGIYHVRVDTDPKNWFEETTRTDNTTWAKIRISGNTVTKL
jgi:Lysyl oxidase